MGNQKEVSRHYIEPNIWKSMRGALSGPPFLTLSRAGPQILFQNPKTTNTHGWKSNLVR